jgi:FKBP-type peptidyl-prolyl cis-trans isomerase
LQGKQVMAPLRIIAVAFALLAAPVLLHAQREKLPPDDLDFVEKKWPDAKKSNTGIRYVIEEPGKGPLLAPGDMIMVCYTGSLLNGKVFDKQLDQLHPLTFRVNRGDVIEGWDQILQLMRPGSKWLVIIPPELGYGRRGNPPRVPGDSTLVFEMNVLGIKKDG